MIPVSPFQYDSLSTYETDILNIDIDIEYWYAVWYKTADNFDSGDDLYDEETNKFASRQRSCEDVVCTAVGFQHVFLHRWEK